MNLDDLTTLAARHLQPQPGQASQYLKPLQNLGLFRQNRSTSFEAAIYDPVLILVLQGQKETVLGTDAFMMNTGECLLVSHDLPVISRITNAPYFALIFDIELSVLGDLYEAMAGLPAATEQSRALSVHSGDARLIDALYRYLALADSESDAKVLGPLIAREIHYRLATAPCGAILRDLLHQDSHASAIARAIAQLRRDFRAAIDVPTLARNIGMSTSSFHKHFKAITTLSPLQYRKGLQLLEARRLLRSGTLAVTAVAFEVGYESAAQFSRDYARRFGVSPKHDMPQND